MIMETLYLLYYLKYNSKQCMQKHAVDTRSKYSRHECYQIAYLLRRVEN